MLYIVLSFSLFSLLGNGSFPVSLLMKWEHAHIVATGETILSQASITSVADLAKIPMVE